MSGIVGDNTDDGSGVINAPTGGATVSSSDPTTSTNAALMQLRMQMFGLM